MKKALFVASALSLMASIVLAADGRSVRSALTPGLLGQPQGIAMPAPLMPTPDPTYDNHAPETYVAITQPVTLFPDVRYHAQRNIAPCAVPTIIQVADPCNRNPCCKTCVNVQVCVPPCEAACVKVTRDGHKVRYDFGKYAVVAKTVGDHVVVHYID